MKPATIALLFVFLILPILVSCQAERCSVPISEIQTEKELKSSVENQEKEIADLKEAVNLAMAEQVKYVTFLSYLTAGIIGCVTVVFAAGVFVVYKENRYLVEKAKDELQQCQNLKANFEVWFRNQDQEIKKTFASELKEYQRETENLNNFNYLKALLEEQPVEPIEIYAHLTPLVVDPKLIYRPLFQKISDQNVNAEITAKAKEGIEKIIILAKKSSEKKG